MSRKIKEMVRRPAQFAGQDLLACLQGLPSGRPVVRCEAEGRDIACEMVRMGHATDWPLYSKGAYARCGDQDLAGNNQAPARR